MNIDWTWLMIGLVIGAIIGFILLGLALYGRGDK